VSHARHDVRRACAAEGALNGQGALFVGGSPRIDAEKQGDSASLAPFLLRIVVKTNYVLIDYENVQPTDLTALDQEYFKIKIFVGANQSKLSFDVIAALQRMGSRAEYIKISGNGPNALDFHIAFYVGVLATTDPGAYFHIISNDAGFDPLIQHLREKKISIGRVKSIQDIHIFRIKSVTSLQERVELVRANLQQRKTARPRTLKTLSGTINALFAKTLAAEEVTAILQELQRKQIIVVAEDKVTYNFPAE
jgi:hypothetical protein